MIKMIIMDVDGTLTDGKIYIGESGEIFKAFNVKDGCGIKDILPQYGIIPVIITGRKSLMNEKRANELNISEIYQGVKTKTEVLNEIMDKYGFRKEEVAYIGDDLPDIEAMQMCGLKGCPKNSSESVKNIANYVSPFEGGDGAVRDFIEWIINTQ